MQQGIDTSKWSGEIDWQAVLNSGLVKFSFNKATEGTTGIDPQFSNNKNGCNAVGIPHGAYHFFRPSYDAVLQANHFVNIVGNGIKRYVCDVETTVLAAAQSLVSENPDIASVDEIMPMLGGRDSYSEYEIEAIKQVLNEEQSDLFSSSESLEVITLAQKVKNFMERVYQLTGQMGIIYTSPGFWNALVAPGWIWEMPYDLWVAHWGVIKPTIPIKWTDWVFWQYTTTLQIPGIPSYEDGNWAKDSLNLYTYFGNGNPTPPPPPPQVDLVRVIASSLYMRSKPYGAIVGNLKYGNILKVTKVEVDPYYPDKYWYYSGDLACFAGWWTEPY